MKMTYIVFAMSMISLNASSSYTLASSEEEAARLRRQNTVMLDNAKTHLKKAALKDGQTVIDIGCGGGDMTLYLAEAVGPNGHVLALDVSEAQLTIARSKIQAAGFQNVTYVQCDIQDAEPAALKEWQGKLDLAYSKLVFMHLTKPEAGVVNMTKLLKVGGIAAVQDSIWSESPCQPPYPPMEYYCQKRIDLGYKRGQDCKIGAKLEQLFPGPQWAPQDYYVVKTPTALGGEGGYIANFRAALNGSRQHYLDEAILSRDELVKLEQGLAATPPKDMVVILTQAYLVAEKI